LISQNKDLKYLIGALSEIESVLFEEGETEMNMNLTPNNLCKLMMRNQVS
jgi:hypothetical protein